MMWIFWVYDCLPMPYFFIYPRNTFYAYHILIKVKKLFNVKNYLMWIWGKIFPLCRIISLICSYSRNCGGSQKESLPIDVPRYHSIVPVTNRWTPKHNELSLPQLKNQLFLIKGWSVHLQKNYLYFDYLYIYLIPHYSIPNFIIAGTDGASTHPDVPRAQEPSRNRFPPQ